MNNLKKMLITMSATLTLAAVVAPVVAVQAQDTTPSGATDWVHVYETGEHNSSKLKELIPGVYEGYGTMAKAALAEGEVTAKEKEYVALALSVAASCEKCISNHTLNALKLGATRQEVAEVLGVNMIMGGGPASVSTGKALDAYDVFSVEYADEIEEALASLEEKQATENKKEKSAKENKKEKNAKTTYNTKPSGGTDWVQVYETGEHNSSKLKELIPGVYEGYGAMAKAALSDGEVSAKQKEYVALALSVAASCEKCISNHTLNALKQGATRQEVAEVLGVNMIMGGGPASVSTGKAIDAYDVLSVEYADEIEEALAEQKD